MCFLNQVQTELKMNSFHAKCHIFRRRVVPKDYKQFRLLATDVSSLLCHLKMKWLTSTIRLLSKLSVVSEASFCLSSRVTKPCSRLSSTRSWTWCSCSFPSTVWRSWTSTPPTARACCPSTSPSWPTTCPWPSCCCGPVPRRALTVSAATLGSCSARLVTWVDLKTLSVEGTNQITAPILQFLGRLCGWFNFFFF